MIQIFKDALLDLLALKVETLNGLYIRLYKNNLTPDRFTGIDDFIEADFDGYAAIGFVDWGTPFLNADDDAEVDHDPIVWTQTGAVTPNDVYGYFVTSPDGTTLWFSERNAAAPVTMDAAGKTYTVIPQFLEGIFV